MNGLQALPTSINTEKGNPATAWAAIWTTKPQAKETAAFEVPGTITFDWAQKQKNYDVNPILLLNQEPPWDTSETR